MRFADLVRSSLGSLWQRKFRTSLTVLGVVIGTMAVVVMVSLGIGMSQAQLDSIERYSSLRQIEVYGTPETGEPGGQDQQMDDAFLAELAQLPGVEAVWPQYYAEAEATVGGVTTYLQVLGVPSAMLLDFDEEYAFGGPPSPGDPLALVYGDKVSESAFWDEFTGEPVLVDLTTDQVFLSFVAGHEPDPGMPPGDDEQPPRAPRRSLVPTSGVLAGEGDVWGRHSTMVYAELDALVAALEKAFPGRALPGQPATPSGRPAGAGLVYPGVVLQTTDVTATEELTVLMRELGYPINSAVEWMEQIQQQSALIQAVFGGIGFVSLLVAAIGIANTMLMSVYERTREIGIMKVLGAALKDIRRMFLLESAGIGFLGGTVGVLVSLGVSSLVNATLGGGDMGFGEDSPLSLIPVWLMLGAITFSTLIGTVAGMVPATRAMRLSALGAIRGQ